MIRDKEVDKQQEQVKSKKRIADHGEVFTNEREVNAMLDLVKQETERIDSRFLEPACGNGNFLAEVLKRKLNVVNQRYSKSQMEWERYAIISVSSIYGVDILEDNVKECRERLFNVFDKHYTAIFNDTCKYECRRSINFLLDRNILNGNVITMLKNNNEPIVFSEWSIVNINMLKRREFKFSFLFTRRDRGEEPELFSDEGRSAHIPEPVKEFPSVHFLKLGKDD